MKNKKKLILIAVIIVISLIAGVYITKETGRMASSEVGGIYKDIKDNVLVFNSGDFFNDYVHIMLKSTDSNNVKDGLEFDVINPKGEKVTSGILYDDEVLRYDYKNIKGQWKIIVHFKDNISSSIIDYGFSVNSKKENEMKID